MITLFESDGHKNIMFNDLTSGAMVQANQHIIADGKACMVLDPGGHKVYAKLFPQISSVCPIDGLEHIFFSHQDPDIIAAANGWLMVTDATAWLPELWMRFLPHFGVDRLVMERVRPIPDQGMTLTLNGSPLRLIPAHFLHSPGNFQVYDPVSKILYSGDLGASLGNEYIFAEDFDAHIAYMEGFHKRYMPSGRALKMWVRMVRSLDVEMIAPQHGAVFSGREMVDRFIGWIDQLSCGLDLMDDAFVVPE
ncbi:MBL fold metallo-hydrolase [Desulfonema ishimotonii]|uniref:MBL fold metallo-hydrolase n=1 Tax=Desulfonema ishimotonii TaxID=45657 RepID=A0A401FVY1_9BACT|nr:MBL fold metallo-hydrolase [Desulfonema ishimotonii]GBC61120.1 MBL fold metallo-hydrolase [Desulfonema ishimotonii]